MSRRGRALAQVSCLSEHYRTCKSLVRGVRTGYLCNVAGAGLRLDSWTVVRNAHQISFGQNCWIKEGVLLNGRSSSDVGIAFGDEVTVRAYTYIDSYGGVGIVVGDRVGIGQYVYLGGNGGIVIEEDAMISGHTYIVSATHCTADPGLPYSQQGESRIGITVERNAWIAANCTIIDGVTVGANSVVAAGSVVTRDVQDGMLYAGVPARAVRAVGRGERRRSCDQAGSAGTEEKA